LLEGESWNKIGLKGWLWLLLTEDEATLLARVIVFTEDEGLDAAEDGAESESKEVDLSLLGVDERKVGSLIDDMFRGVLSVPGVSAPMTMLTGTGLAG
jgi:hypothetical protein